MEDLDEIAIVDRIQEIIPLPAPLGRMSHYVAAIIGSRKFLVLRGRFHPGEAVVVIGKDCQLPPEPDLEQLNSYNIWEVSGFTSDGKIAPMLILGGGRYPVGQDVTKVLGIGKKDIGYNIGEVQ